MHFPYIGSGPYCYANAFAMMLGDHAPSTAVIELATGSPFGTQFSNGTRRAFRRERGAEPRRDRAALKRRIGENVRDAELRGPSEAGRILEGAPCTSRTGFLDVQTRQDLDG
ncbi:hypothetical protein [Sorangium sp. So ce1153]|uniref:hypothetical protein n=1 Tax=Sorangium sp. So ce1153 TaxID=3133333 RepID=UPI003F61BBE9